MGILTLAEVVQLLCALIGQMPTIDKNVGELAKVLGDMNARGLPTSLPEHESAILDAQAAVFDEDVHGG